VTAKDAKKEKGQWVLLEYPAQAGPDTEPIVHTDDFGELPVRTDGQAWTLAFLPEKQIDNVAEKRKGDLLPPSIEALKNPDNEQEPGQGDLPANPGENIPTDVTVPAGDDPAPTTGGNGTHDRRHRAGHHGCGLIGPPCERSSWLEVSALACAPSP
jgi:hypothetical protein